MHPYALPKELMRSVAERTGKIHPFDDIDPRRTALLVIDMQNYFCAPGYMGEVPMARTIVPAINRLTAAVRGVGAHVVWIKGSSDDTLESWSVFNTYLMTRERRDRRLETLAEHHDGHRIWPELDVHPDDGQIVKKRFSAFLQGSSTVDEHLRERNIDTLLIAGTTTDVCCDSTARDASMLNYKTIMVADACATYTDIAHGAALTAFYNVFGDVQTVDEVIASMSATRGRS
jgi:ureidoacrylate peracid hydrolase